MRRSLTVWIATAAFTTVGVAAVSATNTIGDAPVIEEHLSQQDLLNGRLRFTQIFEAGKKLFTADFNRLDGGGRPETNGTGGAPRVRREGLDHFNRISGPDSNSCAGCHNKPRAGGGGDNVANVFVLAQRFGFVDDFSEPDPVLGDAPGTLRGVGNERNTLGMWGSGAIEMLAREMTADLHQIRAQALVRASQQQAPATLALDTKGVNFGRITGLPNGSVDTSAVVGVDPDLIIRPFHQKGVVVSLREFTNNAFNHHHGIQSAERFGLNTDPDKDGVINELTVGDITATTVFQAALAFPGQRIPRSPVRAAAVTRGEQLFTQVGCASCHTPVLELNNRFYAEPNPYNPPGNLRPGDLPGEVRFDLTRDGEWPRPKAEADGKFLVRAFTDLKRHDLGTDPRINNERLIQSGVPTSVFMTRKLWGFASEPSFLHNGCATLIGDAIDAHGGEARVSRDAFTALPLQDRASIVEFLKTLQVLPAGTPQLVVHD